MSRKWKKTRVKRRFSHLKREINGIRRQGMKGDEEEGKEALEPFTFKRSSLLIFETYSHTQISSCLSFVIKVSWMCPNRLKIFPEWALRTSWHQAQKMVRIRSCTETSMASIWRGNAWKLHFHAQESLSSKNVANKSCSAPPQMGVRITSDKACDLPRNQELNFSQTILTMRSHRVRNSFLLLQPHPFRHLGLGW